MTRIHPLIRRETNLPIVNRESNAYIAIVISSIKNPLQSMNQVFIIKISNIASNCESNLEYYISILCSDVNTRVEPYNFRYAFKAQNR